MPQLRPDEPKSINFTKKYNKIGISNGQHSCVMLFIQHDNLCLLPRMLSPLQLVQLFELVVYVLLVFWGCHNKTPQYGWLKQQKLILSGFWKLEVQDKGISRAGHSYGSCMQTTTHLGPHAVFPQCVLLVSLSQGHQSFWIRDSPLQPYLTLSS